MYPVWKEERCSKQRVSTYSVYSEYIIHFISSLKEANMLM